MSLLLRRPKLELPLVLHQGIFRRQISRWQGVTLITGLTIGAGILGIPYAVAKVGLLVGLIYIIGLGLLTIGLNLLIGEIAVRTKGNLQLCGLARKYLGKIGGRMMAVLQYSSVIGVLVVYIIGEGEILANLFGGTVFKWGLIFFLLATFLIFLGIKAIKTVDFFLSLGILAIVLLIAAGSMAHLEVANFKYINLADLLFPYGVILFAYSGTTAVIEAHSILANRNQTFKSTIIIAGLISMVVYALFTIIVVGVTGIDTTEIAIIGLGDKLGQTILIFGNVFAVLAMATGFLTLGLSTCDSLVWDYKIPARASAWLVCLAPLVIFLLGLRRFIIAINIVGGVFISLEMLLVILIYWRAKQVGDLNPGKYRLHHTLLLAVLLIIALVAGAIYSVVKLF